MNIIKYIKNSSPRGATSSDGAEVVRCGATCSSGALRRDQLGWSGSDALWSDLLGWSDGCAKVSQVILGGWAS